jgi:hypothetical protein
MQIGNPLQGIETTTHTPASDSRVQSIPQKSVTIFRDSDGRTRVDNFPGKVHMDSGPDAGNDVEEHIVDICDPVKGEMIHFDTAQRSGSLIRMAAESLHRRVVSASKIKGSIFCQMPRPISTTMVEITVEDLGRQDVNGFDAKGWRVTSQAHVPDAVPDRGTETWCSEDLRAVLLVTVNRPDGSKDEMALTQIQRTEPDPSLFEVPVDYVISEAIQQSRPQPAPTAPTAPVAAQAAPPAR